MNEFQWSNISVCQLVSHVSEGNTSKISIVSASFIRSSIQIYCISADAPSDLYGLVQRAVGLDSLFDCSKFPCLLLQY